MRFVQKTIWFIATIVTIALEMVLRIVLFFPTGLMLTILASFFGAKSWAHNNRFLDYCCPWKLGSENMPIASATSNWFDPDTF